VNSVGAGNHSLRKPTAGSTIAACRAGIRQLRIAGSAAATIDKTAGSRGPAMYNRLLSRHQLTAPPLLDARYRVIVQSSIFVMAIDTLALSS
jgi:hypothetical protein